MYIALWLGWRKTKASVTTIVEWPKEQIDPKNIPQNCMQLRLTITNANKTQPFVWCMLERICYFCMRLCLDIDTESSYSSVITGTVHLKNENSHIMPNPFVFFQWRKKKVFSKKFVLLFYIQGEWMGTVVVKLQKLQRNTIKILKFNLNLLNFVRGKDPMYV